MGIAKTQTTAYHPQCDDQVERQKRTLQDMLAAFASEHRDDWDLWIDSVVFAYNTSCHESTGYSSYELIFGRTPRMRIELECGIPLTNPSKHSEYTRSFRSKIRSIREIAKVKIEKARKRQNRQNDERNKTWKPFSACWTGSLVKEAKTLEVWTKMDRAVRDYTKNGSELYKIRSKVGKVSAVHHDHLKVSQIPFGNGQVVPQTPESGDIQVVQNVPEPRPERRNDENGEVVRHIQPRVREARLRKMFGRPFGMVTTKIFHPKDVFQVFEDKKNN